MLERFDSGIIKIFKRIIETAAFFNISRRQAMNYWIGLSFVMNIVINDVVYGSIEEFITIRQAIIGFLILIIFLRANCSYREDDVLSNDPCITNQSFRLFYCFMVPIIILLNFLASLALGNIKPLMFVTVVFSPFWYPYFLINQNSGKRLTLKSWLKNFVKKLTPAPKRALQPVPIRNFSSLR